MKSSGARKLSIRSHMVAGRSKEAVDASSAALHASPIVWAEMTALTCWAASLPPCLGAPHGPSAQLLAHVVML